MNIRNLAIGALLSLSVVCLAQPENPAVRKAAQQFYRKFDAAVAKADVKAIKSMIHPEFISVDTEGRRETRDSAISNSEQMFKMIRDPKSEIKVDKVEGSLNEFTAWVTMKVSYKVQRNGRWTAMMLTEKYAETIVSTSEGYKIKYSQMLPRDYTVPR